MKKSVLASPVILSVFLIALTTPLLGQAKEGPRDSLLPDKLLQVTECLGMAGLTSALFVMDTLPVTSVLGSAIADTAPMGRDQNPIFPLADVAGGALTFFAEAYVASAGFRAPELLDQRQIPFFQLTRHPYESSLKLYKKTFRKSSAPCKFKG